MHCPIPCARTVRDLFLFVCKRMILDRRARSYTEIRAGAVAAARENAKLRLRRESTAVLGKEVDRLLAYFHEALLRDPQVVR